MGWTTAKSIRDTLPAFIKCQRCLKKGRPEQMDILLCTTSDTTSDFYNGEYLYTNRIVFTHKELCVGGSN
jgi:hypothetical protein